jgi:cardiolipin synthase
MSYSIQFWGFIVIGVELLGIAAAAHAVMNVRSDQGTIAWCLGLIAMPFIALPLYAVFGRAKFARYRETISEAFDQNRENDQVLVDAVSPFEVDLEPHRVESVLSKLSRFSFTRDNRLELLINGEATFEAIFNAIRGAESYIFIEFYTIRSDKLGNQLRDLLVKRSAEGIKVCLLYDEIGSKDLPENYLRSLRVAGVEAGSFGPPLRRCDLFHLNFRNHRKIVVVDGHTAFVGGHNVGDDYLGKSRRFGAWRDTHVVMQGPAALDCQRIFLESWYWATRKCPDITIICPVPQSQPNGLTLVLPTGPIRGEEVCTLAYNAMINQAKVRCWITSPYFAPAESTLDALRYAALSGVDVRIMLPEKPDHWLVHLASYSYLEALEEWKIQVYRYEAGFLHQKVILIDETIAGVTTINLDQRSFHLNFEIGLFATSDAFVQSVAAMLATDFENSRLVSAMEYHHRGLLFRVGVNVARLFSPVL